MIGFIIFIGLLLLSLFVTGIGLHGIIDSLKDRSISDVIEIGLDTFILIGLDLLLIGVLFTQTHICPNCDKIYFGDNYCVECGESFCSDSTCFKCHKANSKDNNYCYYCGEKLEK